MDRIILDIKDKLYDGDILIYKNGKLVPMSANKLTKDLYDKYELLENEIKLQNEKLKAIHDVLDLLLNGDEQ